MSLGPGPLADMLSSGVSRMALEELLLVFAAVIRRARPGEAAVMGDFSWAGLIPARGCKARQEGRER